MKKEEKKISEIVEDFLNLVRDVEKNYDIYDNKIKEYNDKNIKGLHLLEFSTNANERSRIATKTHHIQRARRDCKDKLAVIEPLHTYITEGSHTKSLNVLKSVLGRMRKAEEDMKTRYYPYTEDYLEI